MQQVFGKTLLVPIGLVQIAPIFVMILLLVWSFRTLATLQGEQILSVKEMITQVGSLLLFGIGDPTTLIEIHFGTRQLGNAVNLTLILALLTFSSIFSSIGTALMIRTLSNIC